MTSKDKIDRYAGSKVSTVTINQDLQSLRRKIWLHGRRFEIGANMQG